jgi:hypothetical protein
VLYTINRTGSVNKHMLDTTQAAWSPSGKYLAANNKGNYVIFDTSLHQLSSFSAPQSAAIAWLNNTTVVYNIANQLWRYDVLSKQSSQLVLLGAGNNITGIFPSQDSSYVYFATTSPLKSQLFRVALKGQSYDRALSALSSFLPKDVGVCTLNYVNFSKPAVLIQYPSFESTASLCEGAAKGQLRYFGLDPDSFGYIVSATPAITEVGD